MTFGVSLAIIPWLSYEEMYNLPGASVADDVIHQSIVEADGCVEVEGGIDPSTTNGPSTATPDSVDSTPVTVERRRNMPSVSRQRSMDEALQLGLR